MRTPPTSTNALTGWMVGVLAAIAPLLVAHRVDAVAAEPAPPFFDTQHQKDMAANPPGVTFTLSIGGNGAKFRQGEIIPLVMSFSSATPNMYILDSANLEFGQGPSFHVDPDADVVVPLRYSAGGGSGGLGPPMLSRVPESMRTDVNEWERFERPGTYRLYVVTDRIASVRTPDGKEQRVPVASNAVRFEIIPADAEWQAEQLEQIRIALDRGGQGWDHREAARALRYLDSEDSIQELARRLSTKGSRFEPDYFLGLIGSSHPAIVVREMEKLFEDPECAVSSDFINALVTANLSQPNGIKNDQDWTRATHDPRYQILADNCWHRLVMLLPKKTGKVAAGTLTALAEWVWRKPQQEWPDWSKDLPDRIRAVFTRLPAEQQDTLLNEQWDYWGNPTMAPLLRTVFEGTPGNGYEERHVRETALRLLYHLQPADARLLILADIAKPLSNVGIEALGILPEKTLPELDTTMARNLAAAHDPYTVNYQSALIQRYATPAILPRIKAIYNGPAKGWAWPIQTSLLAYFLRVDPEYGAQMVRQALADRGTLGWHRSLLNDVSRLQMTPTLERIAIETLDDADPQLAANAALMLGLRGSGAAEQPLWDRLEKWHQHWQGQSARFASFNTETEDDRAQVTLEQSLCQALGMGLRWLADLKTLQKIQDLCVSEQTRQQVSWWITNWKSNPIIRVAAFTDDKTDWMVAQYWIHSLDSFREKLLQFPAGTTFEIRDTTTPWGRRPDQLIRELTGFLQAHGYRAVDKRR